MEKEKRFFRMVLPYLPRYWKVGVLAVFCMALAAATNGGMISLIKPVLTQLFPGENALLVLKDNPSLIDRWHHWIGQTLIAPFQDRPMDILLALAGIIILATFLKGFFDFSGDYFSNYLTQAFLRDFRNDLFGRLSRLSLDFYSETGTGSIMSRIVNDVEVLGRSLLIWGKLIAEPFNILGLLIIAFGIDAKLTLFAAVAFPLSGLLMTWIGRRIRRSRKRAQEKLGILSQGLSESFSSIRVVQSFGAEDFEQARFNHRTQRLFKIAMKITGLKAMTSPLMEFLGALGVAGALLVGGYSVIRSQALDGADFINLIVAIFFMYQPFKSLSKVYNDFQQGVAAADRVMEVYEIQPRIADRPGARDLKSFERDIVFDRVSFSYSGGDDRALRDVDFTAPKGSKIALVGPTGAGKSTLVDLLARFYDVTAGAIRVDGRDIRDITVKSLRNLIAFVPQEQILFNDTVAANIAYSRPEATREEIEQAARQAFAHDFITQLSRGYETIIGERGTALSGGQCQRVAIARALLKRAPILILDEATSALDAESEKIVQKALEALIENHTTFIIAHRLSTVRHADMILVLDQGRIAGRGAHEELLAGNPLYQKLYQLQFFGEQQEGSQSPGKPHTS